MAETNSLTIPTFDNKQAMTAWATTQKATGKRIAIVPTMGALHQGHLSLVQQARAHGDCVIGCIYINPTQFAANEDFDSYPRSPQQDALLMQQAGCDAVFLPTTFYHVVADADGDAANVINTQPPGGRPHPEAHETWVEVARMQQGLCSTSRPHFFRGVATIAVKLLNVMRADVLMLGLKDYQQCKIVLRLIRDLDFPVTVVECETVREADGLAMSSRNANLSPEARAQAPAIYRALLWAQSAVRQGQETCAEALVTCVSARIAAAGGTVDYVETRHADNLEPVTGDVTQQPTVVAVAAWFAGKRAGTTVRLIDNIVL